MRDFASSSRLGVMSGEHNPGAMVVDDAPLLEGSLTNQVAVVTGGSRGIGFAAALGLAKLGANVLIVGQNAVNDEAGGHTIAIGADISCATEVDTAVYRATVELWPINMLFNHAGTIMIKPFLDTTEEEWDWLHAVNVKSMILVHLLHFGPLQHNQGHVPSVRLRDGGRVPRSQHTV